MRKAKNKIAEPPGILTEKNQKYTKLCEKVAVQKRKARKTVTTTLNLSRPQM